MRRTLTDGETTGEFWDQLACYEHTALRWEAQRWYEIGAEDENLSHFLAGTPRDPMADEFLAPWMLQVAAQTRAGKRIGRLRVIEEPPTDYQRWELWLDRWNTEAGEEIEYLPRSYAERRLRDHLPFGDTDWWLFDNARVMIMHFDGRGRRIKVELSEERADVQAAIEFFWLARSEARRYRLQQDRRAA
jgi:hypothetical protein